ncbi:hypothetical protein CLF_107875 [Clonorchis sinensis]|uniref:Uncharacterized protein n=1 Tax=Clonorchis sinensis TaxID=79923 RepID=G7YHB0_CLOSI|nr:hypothetical protein CLF_107875 [Clonorchis sinensis]
MLRRNCVTSSILVIFGMVLLCEDVFLAFSQMKSVIVEMTKANRSVYGHINMHVPNTTVHSIDLPQSLLLPVNQHSLCLMFACNRSKLMCVSCQEETVFVYLKSVQDILVDRKAFYGKNPEVNLRTFLSDVSIDHNTDISTGRKVGESLLTRKRTTLYRGPSEMYMGKYQNDRLHKTPKSRFANNEQCNTNIPGPPKEYYERCCIRMYTEAVNYTSCQNHRN